MSEVGTVQSLRLKEGDVVECVENNTGLFTRGKVYSAIDGGVEYNDGFPCRASSSIFRIISRANVDKYGPWQLATHTTPTTEGMQVSRGPDGEIVAYRVKVEPKVEVVTMYGAGRVYGPYLIADATHKITFNTIDDEPDCASVKMEKL